MQSKRRSYLKRNCVEKKLGKLLTQCFSSVRMSKLLRQLCFIDSAFSILRSLTYKQNKRPIFSHYRKIIYVLLVGMLIFCSSLRPLGIFTKNWMQEEVLSDSQLTSAVFQIVYEDNLIFLKRLFPTVFLSSILFVHVTMPFINKYLNTF